MYRFPLPFGYVAEVGLLSPTLPLLLFTPLLTILVFGFTGAILVFLPLTFRVRM